MFSIKNNEERLKLALEAAEIGIWDWDIVSGTLTWSETLEKLFGFEPGTFPGTFEAYRDRVHPDDFASMQSSLQKALSEKKEHFTEHRVLLPNGRTRWIHGRGKATYDDNGNPLHMVGTSIDITARKASEDALIENLPNMVFVKDAKELRFVRFNKAGEDLLGYTREDLIGKNDYDFFTKDQADFFTSKDRAVLSGHVIVDIPEETIQTKHNGARILHTKKIPIFGEDGKPEFLLGISEDITEFKKAEEHRMQLVREQVARAEADRAAVRSRFLAEASTSLASSLNYRKTLQRLSELAVPKLCDWCTVTMAKEDSGEIERLAVCHSEPEKVSLLNELSQSYATSADKTHGIEQVILTGQALFTPDVPDELLAKAAKDERHLELMRAIGTRSCIIVPIKVREKTLGAISLVFGPKGTIYTYEDLAMAEELGRRAGIAIENARLYEQAQRAIQLRNEFLSIASHELKTPITSLMLQIQLARRKIDVAKETAPSPEKLAKVFDFSQRQVNRLSELIEELLDVTRIEAGKLIYSFAKEDLGALARDVVETCADQLTNTGCRVELALENGVTVSADRFRLEQVIINLLSNAMKYGAGKPIHVSVRKQGSHALLEVKDHGIGLEKEQQERIFDRFERVSSNHNIGGLGLGLYISKQIVLGHNGAIRVESAPNMGSTFTVEFQLA